MALSTDDFTELSQLYAKYCYGVDQDDPEFIVSMFTPDGAFERVNTTPAFPELKRFEGHDVLREFFSTWSQGMPPHQHWINNLWFEDSDSEDAVTGHASFAILHEHEGLGRILSLGNYRDEVVRVDGRWLFKNRFISFLY